MRRRLALAALLLLLPAPAAAQGLLLDVGATTGSPRDVMVYRAGLLSPLARSVEGQVHAQLLRDRENGDARRWGAGIELALWRGGRPGPYAAGSLDAGFISRDGEDFWAGLSVGGGYEVQPAPWFSLALDARWRELTGDAGGSVQVGLSLAVRWGGARGRGPRPAARASAAPVVRPAEGPPPAGAPGEPVPVATAAPAGGREALIAAVIATAREEMGRRYQLGGRGGENEGFDCSGLIQYAYARHGVLLPRTSAEQAGEGAAVEKSLAALQPGDLLTFATRGSRVSHVGMYLGDGRFIHSASTGGVQESVLSPNDPYGAWWYQRWIGVRRVVP